MRSYGIVLLLGGACGQHVSPMRRQAGKDPGYLLRSLALTEDHLRHALAQLAVMVNLGKSQILEGKMAKPGEGLVRSEFLGADPGEELAEGGRVHGSKIIVVARAASFELRAA